MFGFPVQELKKTGSECRKSTERVVIGDGNGGVNGMSKQNGGNYWGPGYNLNVNNSSKPSSKFN